MNKKNVVAYRSACLCRFGAREGTGKQLPETQAESQEATCLLLSVNELQHTAGVCTSAKCSLNLGQRVTHLDQRPFFAFSSRYRILRP
jgi:hypothetical protein